MLAYRPGEVAPSARGDGVALACRTSLGIPWAIRLIQRGIEGAGGRFRVTYVLPRRAEVVAWFDAGATT